MGHAILNLIDMSDNNEEGTVRLVRSSELMDVGGHTILPLGGDQGFEYLCVRCHHSFEDVRVSAEVDCSKEYVGGPF
jgi:hypothetical protein